MALIFFLFIKVSSTTTTTTTFISSCWDTTQSFPCHTQARSLGVRPSHHPCEQQSWVWICCSPPTNWLAAWDNWPCHQHCLLAWLPLLLMAALTSLSWECASAEAFSYGLQKLLIKTLWSESFQLLLSCHFPSEVTEYLTKVAQNLSQPFA